MQTDLGFSRGKLVRVLQAGVSLSEPCSQDLSADLMQDNLWELCFTYSEGVQVSPQFANASVRGRF